MPLFSRTPAFNPAHDIPLLSGKVILVTGGSSGLGEHTITAYLPHKPARIYLAARSQARADEAIARIRSRLPATEQSLTSCIEFLELDLASLSSVKAAGTRLLATADRLDILQLNGGISDVPPARTADGYERIFGTNLLGHAALVQVLMPLLVRSAATAAGGGGGAAAATTGAGRGEVRLVWMSSAAHGFAPKQGVLFDRLRSDFAAEGAVTAYGHAMLAKNLFAAQMATRFGQQGLHNTAVMPGLVRTPLLSNPSGSPWYLHKLFQTMAVVIGVEPEEGVKNQLWASVSRDAVNGTYYDPVGKTGGASKHSLDVEMGDKLWNWIDQELLKHQFPGWPTQQ